MPSMRPNAGLELRTLWPRVRHLSEWATEAPLGINFKMPCLAHAPYQFNQELRWSDTGIFKNSLGISNGWSEEGTAEISHHIDTASY